MRDLPTWWYNTKYFWIGAIGVNNDVRVSYLWKIIHTGRCRGIWSDIISCTQLIGCISFWFLSWNLKNPVLISPNYAFIMSWLFGSLGEGISPNWSKAYATSSWSYLTNLTYIGNAVFVSMDVPDTFFAVSYTSSVHLSYDCYWKFAKLLNYLRLQAKIPAFAFFIGIWRFGSISYSQINHLNKEKVTFDIIWTFAL